MRAQASVIVRLVIAIFLGTLTAAGHAAEGYAIGLRQASFTDDSRSVKASSGFAGAPVRRIDVIVWYPAQKAGTGTRPASGGPWPLVIYSHGTNGAPDNNMHLVNALVAQGYVVAAPAYPLSSTATYTRIEMTDISDVINQTTDIRFLIDRLLADPVFAPMIDAARIGTTGHSLGGVTSYFASFGAQTRDPRIGAVAPLGAADPVTTALAGNMGLWGSQHAAVSVPTLFVSGENDVFARTTGRPHAAYARIEKPKYELMIRRAPHVWFTDNTDEPPENKNPDCLFFERYMPAVTMPGCEAEARVPLIEPARQKEITRAAVVSFFDAYLKQDAAALARLRGLAGEFTEVDLLKEE
jgi:predicted dienelactone hydrolase